ncbi:GumC family protein [Verrucomicrobiota bacterium]
MKQYGVAQDESLGGVRSYDIFNTRLEKFKGNSMRKRVAERLAQMGVEDPTNAAVATISLVPDSYLMRFTCRDADPGRAAVRANVFGEMAEEISLEENRALSDKAVVWLRAQAISKQVLLDKADNALIAFRRENKIDLLESQKKTAEQSVMNLSLEFEVADGEANQAESLAVPLNTFGTNLTMIGELPDETPRGLEIRKKLGEWRGAKTERDNLLIKYRPQHPKITEVNKQIGVLEKQLLIVLNEARLAAQQSLILLTNKANSLRHRIEEQRQLASELDLRIIGLKGQVSALERERQVAENSYQSILKRIEEARLSADENTTTAILSERAIVSTTPVYPRPLRLLSLGLFVSLLLGVGIAMIREWLDDYVTTAWEVEEAIGAYVLGLVPLSKQTKRKEVALSCLHDHSQEMTEAFAGMRTTLDSPQFLQESRSIVITSTAPEAGKTIVACNLAIMFARGGSKTLLVDLDLRRPQIGTVFSVGRDVHNLTDVLSVPTAGDNEFDTLPIASECENLDLVWSKSATKVSVVDTIASDQLKRFVNWAEKKYDHVVFDMPPHGMISDAGVVSRYVGGVIVVCSANRTRKRALRQTLRHFHDLNAEVLGVVINRISFGWISRLGGYDYYHRDYYSTHYYQSGEKK